MLQVVGADEAIANESAAVAQAIKDDCENDLSEAVPALEAAIQALNTLKPNDIVEVKAMKVHMLLYILYKLCRYTLLCIYYTTQHVSEIYDRQRLEWPVFLIEHVV